MRNKLSILIAVMATLIAANVQAIPITGSITFGGTVNMNGSPDDATAVTGWHGLGGSGPAFVVDADGSFASHITAGDGVSFVNPWSFNSGPIENFWSVGGFTFSLISSHISQQNGDGQLGVLGTGTITGNGFEATFGTWSFTTQNPGVGTPARFSFSAASEAIGVPDGGTTVLLLGAALSGLGLFRKKFRR